MNTVDATSLVVQTQPKSTSWPESFIEIYTSYLNFIKILPHIEGTSIEFAPEGGWNDIPITERILRQIGKSDRVIQLVRNLPRSGSLIAGNSTTMLDWSDSSEDVQDLRKVLDGESDWPGSVEEYLVEGSLLNAPGCELGPDEITITDGKREEVCLVVNCATGRVHDYIMYEFRERPKGTEDLDADDPKLWRHFLPARDAAGLFEEWRQMYLKLTWLSHRPGFDGVLVEGLNRPRTYKAARKVYLDCDWPNKWRRDECVRKLESLEDTGEGW